jgi:small multidrug resistance family-3 protein
MGALPAFGILLLAACLEAGGDALVRLGLHHHAGTSRLVWFAAGAAVLFVYGVTVNAPPWDFGRLLGVYVALFFLVAQVINYAVFGVRPGPPILAGGALIVAGGLVMTFWRG